MRKLFQHKLIQILIVTLCCACGKQSNLITTKQNSGNTIVYSSFINPPNEYRSHPFYSINDSLTEDEISWQIKDFKKVGFGGFYLHSRSGLITEFLRDDWWKVMQTSVDAANEVGLRCMFYDEDKWPSGFAGGIIPRMSEDFRSKCLARLDKNTKLPVGAEIISADSLYNYVLHTMQFGWDIFNGTCYIDLFNPEAVQAFIDVSYKPYIQKYKVDITTYTPAIFSDEPHVHARYFDKETPNFGTLSYSPWLEKKFNELFNYNLRDKLNLLYEEKENWREVRLHYYQAKALAFEESYTKQLADFCGANGFNYTGHYLAEDVLQKVRDRAANTMLHYRSMQQPGIDMLGLSFDKKLITARNLSSVANQFGKEKRLSELFGISGQNMNFEDRKWLAGWHSILGINHFCPHLTLYSLKGHRKRDYPPTFSYQQPYWDYNKKIEDYLGRIAYATTIGIYAPQILVISPLESEYIKGSTDGEFTAGMLQALDELQAAHYDYDIGDEQILADTAYINENELIVGEMGYKHIILPDMISIRKSTIKLLLALQKKGGLVFNMGRFPNYVDGNENSTLLNELKKTVINVPENQLGHELQKKINPHVKLSGKRSEKIWTQTRIVEKGKLIQLYNSSRTVTIRFTLASDFNDKNIVLWEPSEIKCYSLSPDLKGNYTIELKPSSNIWITSGSLSKTAKISSEFKLPNTFEDVLVLKNKWEGKRLSPNAITLDFAQYSTNGGKTYSENEPVIGIFSRLSNNNYNGELILKYPFQIDELPKACNLVLEQPAMYTEILANRKRVKFEGDEYYLDRTFKSQSISKGLIKGKNNIQLKLKFKAPKPLSSNPKERYGTEIESIYLTGDFALKAFSEKEKYETYDTQRNQAENFQKRPVRTFTGFALSSEKSSFAGSLVFQGYPFFAGSFELNQSFEMPNTNSEKAYFIELPNCEAIASIIEINGQVCDTLVWAPFHADISEHLKKGENTVKITLVNSLRNLLGPHHHKGGELIKVGPKSFTGSGGFPDGRGEKEWYDIRKSDGKTAIWTDTYNHIPFGFIENVKITSSKK